MCGNTSEKNLILIRCIAHLCTLAGQKSFSIPWKFPDILTKINSVPNSILSHRELELNPYFFIIHAKIFSNLVSFRKGKERAYT